MDTKKEREEKIQIGFSLVETTYMDVRDESELYIV